MASAATTAERRLMSTRNLMPFFSRAARPTFGGVVNRTPFTRDTVVMYEGGGACWDQQSCLGIGHLSASNPDGIPPNYLSSLTSAAFGLVTPFTARADPAQ